MVYTLLVETQLCSIENLIGSLTFLYWPIENDRARVALSVIVFPDFLA